jgi:hypothetical protein
MGTKPLLDLLDRIVPFRFLRREVKLQLLPRLKEYSFRAGDVIIRQGDREDKRMYLVASGSVEALDPREASSARFTMIEAGGYFGEFEILFQCPRLLEIRALSDTVLYGMEGDTFLDLLAHRPFAQSLGAILRDKQGIFAAFGRFKAELMRGIARGYIELSELLPLYVDLEPALHPLAKEAGKIDLAALLYAVRRLPENVTSTFAYLLTDELPPAFASADSLFPKIETRARIRFIWEIMPGKSLALLRNGLSDLTDLVTCLCLYAVEANKIRTRFRDTDTLVHIKEFLNAAGSSRTLEANKEFLRTTLGFSREEISGLTAIWAGSTVERVYDIVRHREVFSIDVRRQRNNFSSRRSELWTQQIGDAARMLTGCDPTALPPDVRVHIISSNTHSIINCLNPWLMESKGLIFDWAERTGHPIIEGEWHNEFDLLYGLVRDFFVHFPEAAEENRKRESDWGILRLEETASTGIQVQIVDGTKLEGLEIDPGVVPVPRDRRVIIVNIDYAFGEQAEHVIRNLIMLFGTNLASINFLGKAGALQGKRGDILIPTAFIKQSSERYELLPQPSVRCKSCLLERVPGRSIHEGPMLTVDGTLLQNRRMLYFYKHIWGCVGIEMEGAYYYRQVLESMRLGVLPEDLALRFYYYVSDLPLDHAANLSSRMSAQEGIPPLYAITREILSEVFE